MILYTMDVCLLRQYVYISIHRYKGTNRYHNLPDNYWISYDKRLHLNGCLSLWPPSCVKHCLPSSMVVMFSACHLGQLYMQPFVSHDYISILNISEPTVLQIVVDCNHHLPAVDFIMNYWHLPNTFPAAHPQFSSASFVWYPHAGDTVSSRNLGCCQFGKAQLVWDFYTFKP